MDSVLGLAKEVNLEDDGAQVGGGDVDSVLGLLEGTDLEEGAQVGGGDFDMDSVLGLAKGTDLEDDVAQVGGGDVDSILDMANKAGLV